MKLNPLRMRTRLGLRILRNRCEAEGHAEHVALIDEALAAGDEVLDSIALGTEEMRIGPNEIYLGGGFREGGRLLDFFDWFLENGPAIIEFIAKILVLFGRRPAV